MGFAALHPSYVLLRRICDFELITKCENCPWQTAVRPVSQSKRMSFWHRVDDVVCAFFWRIETQSAEDKSLI